MPTLFFLRENPDAQIKVVSERLGHSTPGFTMATYQHVIPGMQEEAAQTFAGILAGCAALPVSTR